MMIPYAGPAANECRIISVTPVGAPARLRVEPADPVATLLMDYLIAGKFVLACAAARAIEKYRAGEDPSEWADPSYCQLLIGYSYALGRDRERLDRWCRRTDAEGSLGTDGLVLAAEAALLQLDEARSASIIERAAGAPPPLLAHGADIGQRIASVLLAEIDEPDGESPSCVLSESQAARLRNIRKEFSRLPFCRRRRVKLTVDPDRQGPEGHPGRIPVQVRDPLGPQLAGYDLAATLRPGK